MSDVAAGGRGQGEPPPALEEITFTGAARLELDELLEQLVARARDVQDTQSRLRGLLDAYRQVTRVVDLEEVLRHIVEAARQLVSAQYAALGVVRDGHLVRFLHTGMDERTVAAIGHLPEGKGVLGQLVNCPETLRLPNIADHAASVGFFPTITRRRGPSSGFPSAWATASSATCTWPKSKAPPSSPKDDEELVSALASVAGTAIENATLFEELRRRQAWQAAMVSITTGLLAGDDPHEALQQLVRHACETLGTQGAGVNVPVDGEPDWRVAVTEGSFQRRQGLRIPMEGSITAAAIAAGDLVIVPDPTTDARTTATGHEAVGVVGESLAIPLRGDKGITGVLVASHQPGREGFDHLDRDIVRGIAAHAGIALELAQVRRDNENLRRLEDRAHIAEDLRQNVIAALFRHGLALQGTAARAGKPDVRDSLLEQSVAVDQIISDIRAAVFRLSAAKK